LLFHILNEGDKMIEYKGKGFLKFSELMEAELGGKERKEFSPDFIVKFGKKIEALSLSGIELRKNLVKYFYQVFGSGERRRKKTPLHTDRDYALEIYKEIFENKISSGKDLPMAKVRFFAFLTGIIEDPEDDKFDPNLNLIRIYANSPEFILLAGETGTGKELHAKVIHYLSPRLSEPFIAVNCSSYSETLLESRLFGIVEGFATNVKAQKGLLETVGKGTLFLDEIGDMPLFFQAQFLRVLETRDFYKVGDYKKKLVFQGQVIAASNKDLRTEIEAKRFREDLYYRLSVLKIELEPLRSFTEDFREKIILNMLRDVFETYEDESSDFWNSYGSYSSISSMGGWHSVYDPTGELYTDYEKYISEEALTALIKYRWPGNYRELRNILKRAYIMAEQKRIEFKHLPPEILQFNDTGHPEIRNLTNIKVIDLFDYADRERREIFRRKIEQVYESGKDLKGVLGEEGIQGGGKYSNIRNKIERILGKEELKKIRKRYRTQ
jgi:DNA-binding NtrC family response regulator